jgi:DNA-directed RNA polymerase subunit RPC12/RpoP
MAAADQKSVCGLQYCGSRVRTKNRNLIEKKVSE